jgi:hypothetical protein
MSTYTKLEVDIYHEFSPLRNYPFKWGRTALEIEYYADKGYILTDKKSKVEVLKQYQESLEYHLFDLDTNRDIKKPSKFFSQFKINLTYNCFGYCFADSKYWIADPKILIEEYYKEVDSEEAEIIVFMEYDGYDDNGNKKYSYSHAVKVLENGNISFKPGFNLLIENVSIDEIKADYNFNHKTYLKRI